MKFYVSLTGKRHLATSPQSAARKAAKQAKPAKAVRVKVIPVGQDGKIKDKNEVYSFLVTPRGYGKYKVENAALNYYKSKHRKKKSKFKAKPAKGDLLGGPSGDVFKDDFRMTSEQGAVNKLANQTTGMHAPQTGTHQNVDSGIEAARKSNTDTLAMQMRSGKNTVPIDRATASFHPQAYHISKDDNENLNTNKNTESVEGSTVPNTKQGYSSLWPFNWFGQSDTSASSSQSPSVPPVSQIPQPSAPPSSSSMPPQPSAPPASQIPQPSAPPSSSSMPPQPSQSASASARVWAHKDDILNALREARRSRNKSNAHINFGNSDGDINYAYRNFNPSSSIASLIDAQSTYSPNINPNIISGISTSTNSNTYSPIPTLSYSQLSRPTMGKIMASTQHSTASIYSEEYITRLVNSVPNDEFVDSIEAIRNDPAALEKVGNIILNMDMTHYSHHDNPLSFSRVKYMYSKLRPGMMRHHMNMANFHLTR